LLEIVVMMELTTPTHVQEGVWTGSDIQLELQL